MLSWLMSFFLPPLSLCLSLSVSFSLLLLPLSSFCPDRPLHRSASSLWSTVINLCTLTMFLKRRFLKKINMFTNGIFLIFSVWREWKNKSSFYSRPRGFLSVCLDVSAVSPAVPHLPASNGSNFAPGVREGRGNEGAYGKSRFSCIPASFQHTGSDLIH